MNDRMPRYHGSPGDLWLGVFRALEWSVAGIRIAEVLVVALIVFFLMRVAFGANTVIPEQPRFHGGLGTWNAVMGNDGSVSYSTMTRGKQAAGAVGPLCNCQMPSPEDLDNPAGMEALLLYKTADPALVIEAGLFCDGGLRPTIAAARTRFHRVGLWFGKIAIRCA